MLMLYTHECTHVAFYGENKITFKMPSNCCLAVKMTDSLMSSFGM